MLKARPTRRSADRPCRAVVRRSAPASTPAQKSDTQQRTGGCADVEHSHEVLRHPVGHTQLDTHIEETARRRRASTPGRGRQMRMLGRGFVSRRRGGGGMQRASARLRRSGTARRCPGRSLSQGSAGAKQHAPAAWGRGSRRWRRNHASGFMGRPVCFGVDLKRGPVDGHFQATQGPGRRGSSAKHC